MKPLLSRRWSGRYINEPALHVKYADGIGAKVFMYDGMPSSIVF